MMKNEKKKRELLHSVSIRCKKGTINTLGFLDTGNNIKDPYKRRGVILINSSEINLSLEESILVPFKTVDSNSLLRCIEIEELKIDDNLIKKKYLLGVSPKNVEIKGASCILPNIIEEELK